MSSWGDAWGDSWGDSWGELEQDTGFYTFPADKAVAENVSSIQGSITVKDDNPAILIVVVWETNSASTDVSDVVVGGESADFLHRTQAGSESAFHNVNEVYQLAGTPVNETPDTYALSVDFLNPTTALTAKVFVWVEGSVEIFDPFAVYSDSSSQGAIAVTHSSFVNSKSVSVANHQQGFADWQTPVGFTETLLVDHETTNRIGLWVGEGHGVVPSPSVIGSGLGATRLAGIIVVINKKAPLEPIGFVVRLRKNIGVYKPLRKSIGIDLDG